MPRIASAQTYPQARVRVLGTAAQTRMVSVARTRLEPRKSARPFKRIICDDISEVEAYTNADKH